MTDTRHAGCEATGDAKMAASVNGRSRPHAADRAARLPRASDMPLRINGGGGWGAGVLPLLPWKAAAAKGRHMWMRSVLATNSATFGKAWQLFTTSDRQGGTDAAAVRPGALRRCRYFFPSNMSGGICSRSVLITSAGVAFADSSPFFVRFRCTSTNFRHCLNSSAVLRLS